MQKGNNEVYAQIGGCQRCLWKHLKEVENCEIVDALVIRNSADGGGVIKEAI
jgi:hypothetical protein